MRVQFTGTRPGVDSGRVVTDDDELRIDPADLEITKTVVSVDGEHRAGGEVVWTLTITNHGTDRAVNVNIEDRLERPDFAVITDTRFTRIPEGRQHTLTDLGSGIDAWIEYLDAGEIAVITLDGRLSQTLEVGMFVINHVTVGSDTPDPNTYNNSARSELMIRNRFQGSAARRLTRTGATAVVVPFALAAIGVGALLTNRRRAA